MATMRAAASDFLSQRRFAVAGVSRTPGSQHGANVVYTKMRKIGYEVFPVNPNADEVEGDRCFRDLASIPGGVDAVVIGTPPHAAPSIVAECDALGIKKVWMHKSIGGGSVSEEAAAYCREHDIDVIAGGCPLMFGDCADVPHKIMKSVLTLVGAVPRKV
jgi:predicted CoA-binding protein